MKKAWYKYKELKKFFKGKKIREVFHHIVASNTSPKQIALGTSIGIFFSIIPTFSIGMFLSLFIAWKKKYNMIATYLGTLVVNPVNSSIIYFLHYQLGSRIIKTDVPFSWPMGWDKIGLIAKQVYLGGIIISTITSVFAYFSLYYLVSYFRKYKLEHEKEKIILDKDQE